MWEQLEPTPPHLTYLLLAAFLLTYALFSQFIRNVLHLSEPPLAVLVGIVLGPYLLRILEPEKWGWDDEVVQEVTRMIVGIQCFAVGIELPKFYFARHWKSVAMMLGPVMAVGWIICSGFAYFIFGTTLPTAMIIGACLTPTDPVLAASVLSKSKFSARVPARLRNMLSAESACNDGISFPFLYVGLAIFKESTTSEAIKEWFLVTILWQCTFGIIVGILLGKIANFLLRFSDKREYISRSSFIVFYLLMAALSVGVGSVLGSDDFLVAFGAGVGFANDGWFRGKTQATKLPEVIDLLLNSALFVYFGTIIPWSHFTAREITPTLTPGRLVLFLLLVLAFRRMPIILALKRFTPDITTWREALFCGHFGPMGVGALFLAMEARAQLETGTSLPLPRPPKTEPPYREVDKAIELVWPVICFVVFGSTMVHGLSVAAISVGGHFSRHPGERAPLLGGETDGLSSMNHADGDGDSEPDVSGDDEYSR